MFTEIASMLSFNLKTKRNAIMLHIAMPTFSLRNYEFILASRSLPLAFLTKPTIPMAFLSRSLPRKASGKGYALIMSFADLPWGTN